MKAQKTKQRTSINPYPYAHEEMRVISAKVSPETQRAIREIAVANDRTVSYVVSKAIESYINSNH